MKRIGSTVASLATLLAATGAATAAEPSHLRLFHSDAPCHEKPCAEWRAVDQGGSDAFDAVADLTPLRLAPRLRTQALRGQIDLLVNATVSHTTVGGREITRVTVLRLVGVEPHRAVVPAAEPAPAAAAPDASAPEPAAPSTAAAANPVPAAAPPVNANAPPAPPLDPPASDAPSAPASPDPSPGSASPVPATPPTPAAPTTPPEAVAPPAEPQKQ